MYFWVCICSAKCIVILEYSLDICFHGLQAVVLILIWAWGLGQVRDEESKS